MATDQKSALIERWEVQRRALTELVIQAEAHRDKEIYRGWTLKEYLAHMSGWDDAVVDSLHAHAKGAPMETPASRGINAYNAQTVSTRETLDYDHTRREWERSHELVIQAIRDLPDEKLDQPMAFPWGPSGTVTRLVDIFADHEAEHAHHLREWLKHPDKLFAEEH